MKNKYTYTNTQKKAIMHEKGPAAVFAGPGSGKTFVLTEHIYYLIHTLHIEPQNILVITFTKAAALQMEERFYCKEKKKLPVVFKTFHSFFYYVLSQSTIHSNKKILTEKEKKYIIKLIAMELYPSIENSPALLDEIALCISNRKRDSISTKEEKNIIQIYEEEKKKIGKIDFIDLVYLCYELLTEDSFLLTQLQVQFPYILIDEFQDITPIQYEIVKLLTLDSKRIFIVGDEDQTIYHFCGSYSYSMQQFLNDYVYAMRYILEENFRSAKIIVERAQQLINKNVKRFYKRVIATNEKDGKFEVISFQTQQEEIQFIIKKIGMYGEEEKRNRKQIELKNEIKKIAIIMRTRNSMKYVYFEFMKNQIRIESKVNQFGIFQNQRVKDVIAYLKFAKGGYIREDLFLILHKPKRYIRTNIFRGEIVDFDEMLSYMKDECNLKKNIQKLKTEMELLSVMSLTGAIHFIREGIGYDNYLKKLAGDKMEYYKEWMNELDFLEYLAKSFCTYNQFIEFIKNYKFITSNQADDMMRYDNVLKVEMITMHAAKGLEFDYVFIMDVNEGNIPHRKAITYEEMEEERRLLYVSITRAKEEVYLLYLEGKDKNRHKKSRYLKDCILEN